MTEETTTQITQDADDTPQDAPQDVQEDARQTENSALRKARKEAAGYRERLHAVEAERDTLQNQIKATQNLLNFARRAELKHTTVFGRVTPSAVDDVLDTLDIDAVYAEDGRLDETALTGQVETLLAAKPYMRTDESNVSKLARLSTSLHTIGSNNHDRLRTALTRSL